MRELNCAHVLTAADKPASAARTIRIDGESIAAIEAARPAEPFLAMPPLANAHDHARTVRSSSLGASGKPLETWLHYLALVPSIDPYLAAAVSLSRSALGGAIIVDAASEVGPALFFSLLVITVSTSPPRKCLA